MSGRRPRTLPDTGRPNLRGWLKLEHLEDRTAPAVLDSIFGEVSYTAADGIANSVNVSTDGVTYTITDSAEPIVLTSGAVTAGWTGSGTNTVSGPNAAAIAFAFATGDMADTVVIRSLNHPATLELGSGANVASVGPNGALVTEDVSVTAAGGTVAVTVSDTTGTSPAFVTVQAGQVVGLTASVGGVAFADLASLVLRGGSGGNSWAVADTPAGVTTAAALGSSADSAFILGTTGPLTIDAQAGPNFVAVGDAGILANIAGAVSVTGAAGSTELSVDGSAEFGPLTGTMTATGVSGLAAGPVSWSAAAMTGLTVSTGYGDDALSVVGSPATVPTAVQTGEGADTVTVAGPVGPLGVFGNGGDDTFNLTAAYTATTIDGGDGADTYNVQFANGPLPGGFITIADTGAVGTDVANLTGTNAADVFDVNFTVAQRVTLGSEAVHYTAGLETLNVFALDGNDTFRVKPTPNALVTEINLAGGNPVTPIGDTLILNVVGVTNPAITNPALPNGNVTSTSHKTVTWTGIESLPVPLGLGGTFDFNARNTAGFPETQPGYLPLIPTDTFAGGAYAGAAGWQNAVLGFDRKDNGLGVTGQEAALLSDGAWGYDGVAGQGVFRVATGPNVIRVTLTAGDTYFRRDNVAVYANGETTPRFVFNTNTAEFQQAVLDVDMTGDADGILELTIRDEGGYSYWTVNALDVRPLGLVGALIVPTILAPGSADLLADGLTVDTYSGSKAQPGTLLTVTPVGGTGKIVTPDADAYFVGTQVLADGSGNFSFGFLRGTGKSNVVFTVQDVNAASKVVVTQTGYDLPNVRKIDFGPAMSPVQAGYLGFPSVRYTSASKDALGWIGANIPGEFSASGGMGDLLRDGVYNRRNVTGIYHFDLPVGDYWVTATIGDAAQSRAGVGVFGVTGTVLQPLVAKDTPAGQYFSGTFKASTTGGGVLELGINGGTSYWSLNAFEVRPYTAPLSLGGPGTAPANGSTPVTITGSTARANELVTVATDYGTITSPDASPHYAGFQVQADGSGNFSFQFTPALSTTAATAKLTATGVFGGVVANRSQALTAVPPVPPAGGSSQRFDFNANTPGPTAAGFTGVRGSEVYSASVGYGWTAGQLEFERTAASVSALGVSATQVPLYRDGAYGYGSNPGVFGVKVASGTTGINARVYVGDSYSDWANITVQAEGGSVVTSPGRFAAITLAGSDANGDGVFTVTISNVYPGSIWVVNGIDVAVGGSLPGLPLTTAPDFGKSPLGTTVTPAELAKTVDAAVTRWAAAGATPEQLVALRSTKVELGDLDGTGHYGENLGTRIVIDSDAAGRGWFVDATPLADEEFTRGNVPTQLVGDGAVAGMDLLTVVMHEFGHTLGRIDLDAARPGELMTEVLGSGERRLPATARFVCFERPAEVRGVFVGDTLRSTAVAADKVFVGSETFAVAAGSPKTAKLPKPANKPAAAAFDDDLLAPWVG